MAHVLPARAESHLVGCLCLHHTCWKQTGTHGKEGRDRLTVQWCCSRRMRNRAATKQPAEVLGPASAHGTALGGGCEPNRPGSVGPPGRSAYTAESADVKPSRRHRGQGGVHQGGGLLKSAHAAIVLIGLGLTSGRGPFRPARVRSHAAEGEADMPMPAARLLITPHICPDRSAVLDSARRRTNYSALLADGDDRHHVRRAHDGYVGLRGSAGCHCGGVSHGLDRWTDGGSPE